MPIHSFSHLSWHQQHLSIILLQQPSHPTSFIHRPPCSVVYQTTQWNPHPSSSLQLPSSPSRITSASFISCDQRRLVLQVFLSLLCFFILLLFRSLRFSCKKRYGELRHHNARLSNIIRLAPPLQVWAHRTYFFRLVAPKGSKFLIKWWIYSP